MCKDFYVGWAKETLFLFGMFRQSWQKKAILVEYYTFTVFSFALIPMRFAMNWIIPNCCCWRIWMNWWGRRFWRRLCWIESMNIQKKHLPNGKCFLNVVIPIFGKDYHSNGVKIGAPLASTPSTSIKKLASSKNLIAWILPGTIQYFLGFGKLSVLAYISMILPV